MTKRGEGELALPRHSRGSEVGSARAERTGPLHVPSA
jgi:hypothetical protein